jgi:hypothetical protein
VAHTRKITDDAETSVADARGAAALIDGARSARTIIRMSAAMAKKEGIAPEKRRSYVRIDTAGSKSNLFQVVEQARWYKLVGVDLDNAEGEYPADNVQVLEPYKSNYRRREQAQHDNAIQFAEQIAEAFSKDRPRAERWKRKAAQDLIAKIIGVNPGTKEGRAEAGRVLKTLRMHNVIEIADTQEDGKDAQVYVASPTLTDAIEMMKLAVSAGVSDSKSDEAFGSVAGENEEFDSETGGDETDESDGMFDCL